MKIATTPVELMKAPSPATVAINSTRRRVSLLPAFRGLDTHARALAAGVRFSGCTVHFVRAEVDDGPIIVQAAVPVLPGDDPDALAARVLAAEHKAYPLALRLIAEGRVRVVEERVEIAGTAADPGTVLNPPA